MYSRNYGGKTLNFEASGGLTNASLVMQDKETNTYWSLMQGKAVAGELDGNLLKELPIGEKTTWKKWSEKHPDSKVLSVNSRQAGSDRYGGYFASDKGFRGIKASDERLSTKTPVFSFRHKGNPFAVAHEEFESGETFALGDGNSLFLYRKDGEKILQSTMAFISAKGFSKTQDGGWIENEGRSSFNAETRSFESDVETLSGFDTFWYNWSLNNPDTKLLKRTIKNSK